jgi:autotransporter-associated beta strand protein
LRLDLNDPGAVNDQITVTNILTLSGVTTVDASAASGTIAAGTYTLMTYGTLIGNISNLQMSGALANSRYTFVFDTATVPNVNLTVSGATTNLTWSGGNAGNAWDVKVTTNWNGNTERFFDLDTVTFDDSGSAVPAINLSGILEPASTTVSATQNYTFSGSGKLSGSGGLVKDGTGTLTILTANDYTGDTVINAGTVLVNGALGNTTVTLNTSATLGGSGTILGAVTVHGGCILAPGTSIGTLAISNNLVLEDGSTNLVEANLDTLMHDKVIGLNKVTYGGTLNVVLSGRPVTATDTFKFFSATTAATPFSSPYGGAFTTIIPAAPGPYLAWDTSTLAKDGTLRVLSLAPKLSVQVSGNQINLSWPPGNIGWLLQGQTNTLAAGLTTNWTTVPGSGLVDNVNITVDPANGSVFYRLVSP